jgi:4-phytase/acid phosphatase
MRRSVVALLTLALSYSCVTAGRAAPDKLVFAVVVSRHGVRSLTKRLAQYQWPEWSPVNLGFLTRHGYRLMTYMGRFYRSYFATLGVDLPCGANATYVYADHEQRPYESARAIVEGACGKPGALTIYHSSEDGTPDPMFDGSDWFVPAGKVDAAASKAAVAAAAPTPPSAIVPQHAGDFAALQAILDQRCAGTCKPVTTGDSVIKADEGLAELRGPLATASTYAESLFMEYAQCRPLSAMDGADLGTFLDRLQAAMRLHALAYDVNARNSYNPAVRGGNILAHVVGLMEEKAGLPHPDAVVPDVARSNVAFIVGHDTQLGAIGGILDAHWSPGGGIVPDDMPPSSALIFELYRTPSDSYRVRLRFAYQSLAQLRSNAPLPNGASVVPVRFAGCRRDDCSIPLGKLASIAHDIARRGFVLKNWTPNTDAPLRFPPLADPSWTRCGTP